TAIAAVEEQNRRFRELEKTIEVKEQEEKELSKELTGVFRKLGRVLLENGTNDEFTGIFREEADALAAKLVSLESRIAELESKDGGNVFSWIGKGAQGLVLRSFLSKAQENQEQLFRSVGERCSSHDLGAVEIPAEASLLVAEVERVRSASRSVLEETVVLRDEKRVISAGFGIDGSPQKQIHSINHHITEVRECLRRLYRNFGAQTAGITDAGVTPERKYFIDAIVSAEDGEIIGRAVRLNQSIIDSDTAIGKLRAAISIDEEKVKIEKYRKSIGDKKDRIAEFERVIADLEDGIKDSEAYINELQKLL
ncbi:MAG: hypothetical protein LBG91_04705, partial [Treponema sp.]|nr:hypothetical protein [Treponema sp.]